MKYYNISNYKYTLYSNESLFIPIKGFEYRSKYIILDKDGYLTVLKGYSWDGASGPTFDTKNTMFPSLVHDVLYQLIRLSVLPFEYWKKADQILYELLDKCGMSSLRKLVWKAGLTLAQGSAAKPPQPQRTIEFAISAKGW